MTFRTDLFEVEGGFLLSLGQIFVKLRTDFCEVYERCL